MEDYVKKTLFVIYEQSDNCRIRIMFRIGNYSKTVMVIESSIQEDLDYVLHGFKKSEHLEYVVVTTNVALFSPGGYRYIDEDSKLQVVINCPDNLTDNLSYVIGAFGPSKWDDQVLNLFRECHSKATDLRLGHNQVDKNVLRTLTTLIFNKIKVARNLGKSYITIFIDELPEFTIEEFSKLTEILVTLGISVQYSSQENYFVVQVPELGSVEGVS